MNFTTFDIDKLASLKKVVSVDFTKIVNQPDGTQLMLDAAGN